MNFEPQINEISLEEIIPNRFQPRLSFDDKALEELTLSIKEHGIIQPLVLRRIQDKYEIIAGERRFKAAKNAGLDKVPAIITNLDDNNSAEVALIENVQRKNLTPIEEAKSYKILLDRGYLTQEELAKRIGVSQSSVANKLRLLNLDEEVQNALATEKISERHARSLLQLSNKEKQKELLTRIINERMTVRQLDIEINQLQKEVAVVDETPLVDISPSVEEIKTGATDINPIHNGPAIESLLMTESEKTNEIKPEIGVMPPVLEEEKKVGRFFNFLEDEEANMNVSDPSIQENNPFLSPQPLPSTSNIEVLEPSVQNQLPTDLPSLTPFEENNKGEEVNYKEPDISTLVDPVSQIETLDPNYKEPVIKSDDEFDIPQAINLIRNTVKQIEEEGLVIDLEELDLDNLYQVVIKIDKKNE